jgi:hypothetical protein
MIFPTLFLPLCILHFNRCFHCNETILGTVFLSCGENTWHNNHFYCSTPGCPINLAKQPFFEHNGKPYCSEHNAAFFAPLCYECHSPITDTMLVASGNNYHERCLACVECKHKFTANSKFVAYNGRLFCSADFDLFRPFCAQ